MKKIIYLATACIFVVSSLSSCSDDNDNNKPDPDYPKVSNGAYFLCQGSSWSGIEGSFDVLDYSTNTMQRNVFQTVNQRSLGNTPQWGVAYGDKIYLGIYESNTVEVIEKSNYRSIKQIKLEDLNVGNNPRSLVAYRGHVYVAMWDGYVARLDTLNLEFDKAVKVGPNPEVMGIHDGKIYCPNTNGQNYQEGYDKTASVIDLATFSVTKTIEVPLNPYRFFSDGRHLFMTAKGDYGSIPGALYEINPNDGSSSKIADATMAAVYDGTVYMINAPYGSSSITYSKYDINSKTISDWNVDPVTYPNEVAIDPLTGNRLIASYVMSGSYPSYTTPGYVNVYDKNDRFVKKYEIGVGMPCIFFNLK